MGTPPASAHAPPAMLDSRATADGALVLTLSGRLNADSTVPLWKQATAILAKAPAGPVIVEAEGIEYCDGAGTALLFQLLRLRAGKPIEIRGLAPDYQRMLDLFRIEELDGALAPPDQLGLAEEVGCDTVAVLRDLYELVAFVGELFLALCAAAMHPRRVRWKDALVTAEAAGVNGLPIIALIGFLIGLIMSFQAAIPLRQFGADILVAHLIALGMLRELGPLMTAIILAGRTGSAFAAELGAMRVNEEIDALKTMGLEPVRFLVAPRVIAAIIVTPMLTLFANLMGLIGGAVVLMSLGYPLIAYIREAQAAVSMTDFAGGMVKSFVFGILVAAIGCLRGLQTKAGPSAVGRSATRAVVSGIVLIALADGVFAVVYYYLDI